MILDERLEFADATSVGTPNNTTVNVGDVIDLGSPAQDLGSGHTMWLCVQVTTAITSGGSATVSFLLSSDSTATLSVDGTQSVHAESAVIAVASLTAGANLAIPVPIGIGTLTPYERYLGVQVRENAGQALTAGAINAFLTFDPPASWISYPDAVN
jgi:hypothetical protein